LIFDISQNGLLRRFDMQQKYSLAEIKAIASDVLQHYSEILFAILYGSVIEGDDYRDIDIALFVNREQESAREAWHFAFRLAEQLQKKLSCQSM